MYRKRRSLQGHVRSPKFRRSVRFRESQVQNRSSLSLDDLALLTVKEQRNELPDNHPLKGQAGNLLYEAIHRMVYGMAIGYSNSCKEDADDLAQDCMERIISRLNTFKPEMAKFTTWASTVCSSVMNNKYRNESGRNQNLILTDISTLRGKYEPKTSFDFMPITRGEIAEAIRELISLHPDKKLLITKMFENSMNSRGFFFTKAISNPLETGTSVFHAYRFFMDVVRPFFKERFGSLALEGGQNV